MQTQRGRGVESNINVTPFVDVVLVLLVIFMITAPLMFSGIQLELPKTKKVSRLTLNSSQVILSISNAGDYYVGKTKFLLDELLPKLKDEFARTHTDVLYLRAHYQLPYGDVARIMSHLKRNGISKIALVTETEDKDK